VCEGFWRGILNANRRTVVPKRARDRGQVDKKLENKLGLMPHLSRERQGVVF